MFKQACLLCKIVGLVAIAGSLTWGIKGLFKFNPLTQLLGGIAHATTIVYLLFGLSGIALLVSYFTVCPACKK